LDRELDPTVAKRIRDVDSVFLARLSPILARALNNTPIGPEPPAVLSPLARAGLFRKWLEMVLVPFCKLLRVREGWLRQGIQEQTRSPKLSPNHKRRIETILDQFRNTHARYFRGLQMILYVFEQFVGTFFDFSYYSQSF
jgi:hypothetical protein